MGIDAGNELKRGLDLLDEGAFIKGWDIFSPAWAHWVQFPAMEIRHLTALSVGLMPYFADVVWVELRAIPFFDNLRLHLSSPRLHPLDEEGVFNFDAWSSQDCASRAEILDTFIKRTRIAVGNLSPLGTLVPASGNPKGETTPVSASDFISWAHGKGWALPEEFSQWGVQTSQEDATEKNTTTSQAPWKTRARQIAKEILKNNPSLSVDKLAEKTNAEMVDRNKRGEEGMTGRGNKVPAADTIKRHALTGIKS